MSGSESRSDRGGCEIVVRDVENLGDAGFPDRTAGVLNDSDFDVDADGRFEADGLATAYFTPFLDDPEWSRAYEEMARDWYPDVPGFDIRWRMWSLTSAASTSPTQRPASWICRR